MDGVGLTNGQRGQDKHRSPPTPLLLQDHFISVASIHASVMDEDKQPEVALRCINQHSVYQQE